jgi:type I restriction-modification system DNA methylase subunit
MAKISTNEREWQGEVLDWFRKALTSPLKDVTQETGVSGQFPDIIFWRDRAANSAIILCELKGAEISARDEELLKNANEKAQNLGTELLLTWNMNEAIVWRTKGGAVIPLWQYDAIGVKSAKTWREKAVELQTQANRIVADLAIFLREGRLPSHCLVESTVFIDAIYTTSTDLIPLFRAVLTDNRNGAIRWCVAQGIASDDGFETASRQIVYRLIGQILFFQTLSKVRGDLPTLNLSVGDKAAAVQNALKHSFALARNIDYLAVFKQDYPDTLPLTDEIAFRLVRFCNSFAALDLPRMGVDIIGRIFESLIPPDEKKHLGQYFTEPWLSDLLVAAAINSKDDVVLDPTCGTGAILLRAYAYLKHLGKTKHSDLLDSLWGNDVADFPTELAMINLFRQAPGDIINFPRVLRGDVFALKQESTVEMPPNRAGGGVEKVILRLPQFDAIVGNPPYVRYQSIGAGASDVDGYRKALFTKYEVLDSTSDLLAFVFAHSETLLKAGGRLAFVTSNSWIDADYGLKLKRFLLRNFKVLAILESRCEPWFENAKVNTVVTVLEKSPDAGTMASSFLPKSLAKHRVAFVKLKQPINMLVKRPLDDPFRFDEYSRIFAEIYASKDFYENEKYRIRKREQQFLFDGVTEEIGL